MRYAAAPLRLLSLLAGALMFAAPVWSADGATKPAAGLDQSASNSVPLAPVYSLRPQSRALLLPAARWDHRPKGRTWTRAAISALRSHGRPILDVVPRDIDAWCPAYPELGPEGRAAFWAGFLSALAKHESTYRETAVGGGGRWYGLLQILPATARGYKCADPSRAGLKTGAKNLSCAVRILSVTVPRDQAIASKDRKWRGVAADWGPMRSASKRRDMSSWTRAQPYCKTLGSLRPRVRPESLSTTVDPSESGD